MNETPVAIVKDYEFNNPLLHKIDSIIDKCIRDSHTKYFQTFKYKLSMILNLQILVIMKQ